MRAYNRQDGIRRHAATTRVATVRFPGTTCERDVVHALGVLGVDAILVDDDAEHLPDVDAVVLPGGFAHGDRPRPGAEAAASPVIRAVTAFARDGGTVLGICNGFQVLCEAGLLPGRLVGNASGRFVCRDVGLRIDGAACVLTRGLSGTLRLPVAHGAGRWEADAVTRAAVEARGGIVLRYVGEGPAGSDVAGVCDASGSVVGLMPHPERHVEEALGGTDGRRLLATMLGRATGPGGAS